VRAYNCLKRSGLMTVGAVLEKSEEELLALRNFGRKSYDELRDKLISMGFLSPDAEGMGGGTGGLAAAPARTAVFEPEEDEEELGPVAKALLEALKESGAQDLLKRKDEEEDED
jgi:DNA-directed RNA polymerase subunit alpha